MPPNFTLLDSSLADIASLMAAMLQARDAVERRSWVHPQRPTNEEWWADVLADPRARKRDRRTDLAVKQAFYRLADEKRETILVACSKCDWRAAFLRDDLIESHGADYAMPTRLHGGADACARIDKRDAVDLIHAGKSQVRYRARSLQSRLQTTNVDFTAMLDY
jgi:hypothetical protein